MPHASSWTQRLAASSAWHTTALMSDEQQQQLVAAARQWGDEAKAWRDQQIAAKSLTADGELPNDKKHEINHFDGAPRTSSVTIMDKKLGADISVFLSQLTPNIPIINEEASAEANQQALNQARASAAANGQAGATYWVIDPIDGTDNYVDPTKKEYSVLIGLVENGQPRFGLTYYPEYDQLNVTRGDKAVGIHAGKETVLQSQPFAKVNAKGQTARLEVTPNVMKAFRKPRQEEDRALSHALEAASIRTNCMIGGIDEATRQSLDFTDFPNDQLLLSGKAQLSSFNKGGFEWDYAGRHALLRAAGGEMLLKDGSTPPAYGQNDTLYLRPIWLAHPQTLEQIGLIAPSQGQVATSASPQR